jgi:multidrug efflux pump subunit AcrA (membrane-fusion protein)
MLRSWCRRPPSNPSAKVVYTPVEGEDGKFIERPAKLGPLRGNVVQVEGLKPGEKVVTEGSFFLRSEAARTRSGR